jgi:transposase
VTADEIGAHVGCSATTVRRAMRRLGLPPAKPGRKPTPALADRDALAVLIASGLSTSEIADQLRCSTNVVRRWVRRHALTFPPHSNGRPDPPLLRDIDWLREQHHARGRSLTNIGVELGHAQSTVARRFREYGIPIRHQRTYAQLRDAGWLAEQFAAGKSSRTIAREVGCSEAAVRLSAIGFGVAPRRRPVPQRPTASDLRHIWAATGVIRDLARRYHTSDATIAAWLDEAGIERKHRHLKA